jgi:hypothetical protein
MNIFWLAPLVAVLIAMLSRPPTAKAIAKALRGLLADRRELALFAMFEAVAIGATALLLVAVGPLAAGVVLLGCAALFLVWVIRPPAQRG